MNFIHLIIHILFSSFSTNYVRTNNHEMNFQTYFDWYSNKQVELEKKYEYCLNSTNNDREYLLYLNQLINENEGMVELKLKRFDVLKRLKMNVKFMREYRQKLLDDHEILQQFQNFIDLSKKFVSRSKRNIKKKKFLKNDDLISKVKNKSEVPDEQRLMYNILEQYERSVRPVWNARTTVTIRLGLTLTQIFDMDEKNQVLVTNVWLDQEWDDEFLVWNPDEYNNLTVLRLPCKKIWLPDIVLYNNAADFTDGVMEANVMVRNNGTVFWPIPTKLQSSCKVDVTYFPFDYQVCHLKFGSWTYDGFQVDIAKRSPDVDLKNYLPNGEWDILQADVVRNVVRYPCCKEPYPDIRFYIVIRRRILYYLTNVVVPCIMLSALTLLVFCLPPDSGEKIALGITVLLAFSVFMLAIAENMPETSEYVPLISVYLTVVMAMTSISVVMTVWVLNLHHHSPNETNAKAPPDWVRRFFLNKNQIVHKKSDFVQTYYNHHINHGSNSNMQNAPLLTNIDVEDEKSVDLLIDCNTISNSTIYQNNHVNKKVVNLEKQTTKAKIRESLFINNMSNKKSKNISFLNNSVLAGTEYMQRYDIKPINEPISISDNTSAHQSKSTKVKFFNNSPSPHIPQLCNNDINRQSKQSNEIPSTYLKYNEPNNSERRTSKSSISSSTNLLKDLKSLAVAMTMENITDANYLTDKSGKYHSDLKKNQKKLRKKNWKQQAPSSSDEYELSGNKSSKNEEAFETRKELVKLLKRMEEDCCHCRSYSLLGISLSNNLPHTSPHGHRSQFDDDTRNGFQR
ncbi:hypothetical protein SNEBB_004666 [Seison nebaliae]|nr:hypothetical protein SNEBB_004666 [Seison nebaliae]